jgi:uncharacterized protein (DUF1015 family)
MPECLPFCAWRYNSEKVNIEEVVAPPYDVVSEKEIEYFKAKSSYNIFHLELPENYDKAKELLKNWIDSQILIKNSTPGIYFYEIEFTYHGKSFLRKGFILLVKLSSFEEGKILPHEKTYSKVTEDRLELLKKTHFQFSQIFSLYEDPSLETIKIVDEYKEHLYTVNFQNEKHILYKISEKELIKKLLAFFKDKTFYIADGHHRYKTALKFKEYMESIHGKNPLKDYNYIAMYVSPMEDENLLMLPTYRAYYFESPQEIIKKFLKFVEPINSLNLDKEINLDKLFKNSQKEWALIFGEEIKVFRIKDEITEKIRKEDSLFSEIPLYNFLKIMESALKIREEELKEKGKVRFISDLDELIKEVQKGAIGIIFPFISAEILKKVSQAKKLMPHKCTYFYPKILTGLVLNEISGKELDYCQL